MMTDCSGSCQAEPATHRPAGPEPVAAEAPESFTTPPEPQISMLAVLAAALLATARAVLPHNRLFYIDASNAGVASVGLAGGGEAAHMTDKSPAFLFPSGIDIDPLENLVYVADKDLRAIVTTDLDDGDGATTVTFIEDGVTTGSGVAPSLGKPYFIKKASVRVFRFPLRGLTVPVPPRYYYYTTRSVAASSRSPAC